MTALPDPLFPSPLLSIGAFAAQARLSHKALRLYDDLGLLRPAHVDPLTAYRYYAPEQLPRAALIGLLRQLDLPLAQIRTLLDAPPAEQVAQLRQHHARGEHAQARRGELTRYLIARLEGHPMTQTYDVQTRHMPAQAVATLTRHVKVAGLEEAILEGFTSLKALLGAQGVSAAGAPFVIYHGEVNADSDGPIEVCQPYAGTLRPAGEVHLREEAAHEEAYVTLTRAEFQFPGILQAYDATCAYAAGHGAGCALHPREVYPHDWATLGDSDPAGDVAWPYTPR
ncbi:MerR family transcriptional regulator [Deinococcus hohokamensis]|uniref:MerR family transcriptional regulator n=1 Tax=Deinococcus hohokamensis TaxID=309883 RepID=A0ABV9IAR6_9DEIO